jgi:hypothetical protein
MICPMLPQPSSPILIMITDYGYHRLSVVLPGGVSPGFLV